MLGRTATEPREATPMTVLTPMQEQLGNLLHLARMVEDGGNGCRSDYDNPGRR